MHRYGSKTHSCSLIRNGHQQQRRAAAQAAAPPPGPARAHRTAPAPGGAVRAGWASTGSIREPRILTWVLVRSGQTAPPPGGAAEVTEAVGAHTAGAARSGRKALGWSGLGLPLVPVGAVCRSRPAVSVPSAAVPAPVVAGVAAPAGPLPATCRRRQDVPPAGGRTGTPPSRVPDRDG